jgi:hypothetical protein
LLESNRGHNGAKEQEWHSSISWQIAKLRWFCSLSTHFRFFFSGFTIWIPLGRLNNVAAVRSQDTGRRLVTVTLIQSVPWTIGLCFSLLHFRRPYPDWLYDWLVISYGLLFIGQIRAWWIPYLFRPEPERAARYQIMFGKTHSFLPPRNGMVPNTAHILLHLATAATLIVLLMK